MDSKSDLNIPGGGGTTVSVEFEVFGQVQGCFFTKYCKEICDQRGVGGWIKNSKSRTVLGKLQGTRQNIDDVVQWLAKTGSPGCKIEKLELSNWEFLTKQEIKSFSVRF